MALTREEIGKNFYKKRKENGLCPRCGKKLDRKGHYCSECLAKINQYNRETREFCRQNHICTECRKERVYGKDKLCSECRAKKVKYSKNITDEQKDNYSKNFKENQKKLYRQRAELGLCTKCGKRKALNGKKKCPICLQKDAEVHRRKYLDRPNIKEYRQANGLCYFCGKPIDRISGQLCQACWESCKENGMKSKSRNEYWKKDNKLIFKDF